jgi:NADH:ubiquinone reductase (H+-translocating)
MPSPTHNNPPHVIIVGAGFGGLRAARLLAKDNLRVTLVDRNNYHLFQPLLYQVATAGVSPGEIAYPLRSILRKQKNTHFLLAEVTRIDLENKRLETTHGEIHYDALILAAGGQTNTFGIESVAQNSFGLKDLHDGITIRNHILRLFEQASLEQDQVVRQEMLTFVIAGGGPTGVEMAGAISELIQLVLKKDFPHQDFSQARVLLLEAAERLLPALPLELGLATLHALERKGVEVRFKTAVAGFDGRKVDLKDSQSIAARTLIWAAGIRAADIFDQLGVAQAAQRRVRVEPTLQLPGHPEVFVIGDGAYLKDENGAPLPMIAPVALQQADCAVNNLRSLFNPNKMHPFVYKDPGVMATIGRNQAVARLGKLHFRGFIAWIIWVVVHIFQLIGFRNRLIVMITWAWDYFHYDRALRLIGPELQPQSEKSRLNQTDR